MLLHYIDTVLNYSSFLSLLQARSELPRATDAIMMPDLKLSRNAERLAGLFIVHHHAAGGHLRWDDANLPKISSVMRKIELLI